ncbi:MipA/OmpV family protein [Aliivibrio finisterrensis]|uniref:MipA/OmpV family protein n=1 Tax=Aliivibrio finisterrensis TaxID=511998 RepID=UPI0010217E24|nr:MipA/OmpV family protein [Aliivibrio finisterrensis]RYU65567.1 MipA/OmpV family protein [Aliivibrio finisterrensis]RYU68926.1 MipA/OmpV family protein [Aliivibrio finisterrensis]RYU72305.1 MipA/OmpV family protein [Aliivibrio finisterrensis]
MNKLVNGLIVGAALTVATGVNAKISQWSIGAAAAYSPSFYKETPSNTTVIPMVGYEGEHLFLRGFTGGYRLFSVGTPQNIIFRFGYDPRTFKPEDSDNIQMQKLDERKGAILGGLTYQAITHIGLFEFGAGSDIGNTHNGIYAEAVWKLPIRRNGWAITPSLGYSYNSERLNNHLYGVSSEESARSNGAISEFDADWDGQFFFGISTYFHLSQNVRVTGSIRYVNIEGNLEKSSLIEHTVSTTGTAGIAYVF